MDYILNLWVFSILNRPLLVIYNGLLHLLLRISLTAPIYAQPSWFHSCHSPEFMRFVWALLLYHGTIWSTMRLKLMTPLYWHINMPLYTSNQQPPRDLPLLSLSKPLLLKPCLLLHLRPVTSLTFLTQNCTQIQKQLTVSRVPYHIIRIMLPPMRGYGNQHSCHHIRPAPHLVRQLLRLHPLLLLLSREF